jgi:hypothetical protein
MKKYLAIAMAALLLVCSLASCTGGNSDAIDDYTPEVNYLITDQGTFYFQEAEGETAILVRYNGKATKDDHVVIPSTFNDRTVTVIGDEAFRGCVNLIAAEIPPSVEEIGAYAFMDCPKLTIYTTACSEAAMYAQRSGIPVQPVAGAEQLKDKCVVLSGLRGHQREQVMEVLEAVGGIFREEVCGNTAYLIYDPADGTETKKFAEALENQKEATGLLLMDYRTLVE